MEWTCQSKPFREAFGIVARAVPARSPKPVLMSVLLEVGLGDLTFAAQDFELGISHRLTGVDVSQPGKCLLPKEQLVKILSACDGEELKVKLDGDKLTIKAGSARWTMTTEPVDEFPSSAEWTAKAWFTLASQDLQRVIRRTIYAIDPKAEKYALSGLLVEAEATTFGLVATSGRSLGYQKVACQFSGEMSGSDQRIIPSRAAKEVVSLCPDDDSEIEVGFPDKGTVHFRFGNTLVSSRMMEGRFPRWQAMKPSGKARPVPIEVAPFRRAVEQGSAFVTEETKGIKFAFSKGQLRIYSESYNGRESDVTFPVEWSAADQVVMLDTSYLLDMLKSLGDIPARLEVYRDSEPVCVATDEGFWGAIATMTIPETGGEK